MIQPTHADGEPVGRPSIRMRWVNLLFLHWRIDPAVMRRLVPAPFEVDVFDSSAWVGLVPFRMEAVCFRGVPALPGLGAFYECNVRTYVRHRGRPGVWFFSLDAQTLVPVLGGRWLWSLNYVYSRFDVSRGDDGAVIDYRLTRRAGPWGPGRTRIAWRGGEPLPTSTPGSLAYFLTERYRLFSRRSSRILVGEIRHQPWSLRAATVEHLDDTLVAAAGLKVSGTPLAWVSDRLDVLGWSLGEPSVEQTTNAAEAAAAEVERS